MDLKKIVDSIINTHHGWGVAAQFSDTYDGAESLEAQSYSALELIASTVKELLDSELLAEGYQLDELQRYYRALEKHLSEA